MAEEDDDIYFWTLFMTFIRPLVPEEEEGLNKMKVLRGETV
jgi:hypothetical protein